MAKSRIIVIEDDSLMQRAIERLLLAHGFTVDCFSSAEAFLEHGAGSDAACLLLDIRLGGMSGVELRRGLHASGSTLPVIFITAYDNPALRAQAARLGSLAFLTKPFSGRELASLVSAALARRPK